MTKNISEIKPLGFFEKFITTAYSEEDIRSIVANLAELVSSDNKKQRLIENCSSKKDFIKIMDGILKKNIETLANELGAQKLILERSKEITDSLNSKNNILTERIEELKSTIEKNKKDLLTERKEHKKVILDLNKKHSAKLKTTLTNTADDLLKMDKKLKKDPIVTELKKENNKLKKQLKILEDAKALDVATRGRPALSCDDIKVIKILLTRGDKILDISKQYNVSKDTIRRIKIGKTYKHCD